MATTLKVPMRYELYEGPHRVAVPAVSVRLRRGDRLSQRLSALVDTGSAFTLAHLRVAARMGLDAAG